MKYCIIGGAGFIGSNAADYFLAKDHDVTIIDNLSRTNVDKNLSWIQERYPQVRFVKADIRTDQDKLQEEVEKADVVIHLAAQVAVTTSVTDPREDFLINALGTFNVLEAIRNASNNPILLYSSTNKVYGGIEDETVEEVNNRHEYKNRKEGIGENRPLDFHSPYGCSKGSADQYVRDYARIYGLRTIVFRQSCIYGYRQFGVEDQGWVAWFTIASHFKKPITIYGDGKQVRDVLFVEDLVRGYDLAIQNIETTAGEIYNIGGGPENTLSLLELIDYLENYYGITISYDFSAWRPGDQKVFICNISKAQRDFGWTPKISAKDGVERLAQWIKENDALFK
jgi:CDP-paratose 2-epimerase